ncbi:MAG: DMT family transporter [Candidatus Heimdallarchaeota archaeon]
MAAKYALAIFLGMLSYGMLNIGMGLQKKAASSLPKINEVTVKRNFRNFFTNKIWLIGFSMVLVQWVFLTFAMEFAPISMITPLMSFGLVALVLFSYFYLKESLSIVEIIGIIAIIVGIIVLGVTNPSEEVDHDFTYTTESFSRPFSIIFLSVLFALSIVFILISIFRKFANADILFGIAAGITDALGAILLKAVMNGADVTDRSVINETVTHWEWWVFLIPMIFFNGIATIYLQVAYQRGKAIIVAPIFAVIAMIIPVFAGIILYEDWASLFADGMIGKIIAKIIALVTIVVGAIMLSLYSARLEQKNKQEKIEFEEPNGLVVKKIASD